MSDRVPRLCEDRNSRHRIKDEIEERGANAGGTRGSAWVVVSLLLVACVDTTGPPFPHIELTEFAPSLGINLGEMRRIGGGIYVLDLAAGSGATIRAFQEVELSYSLHLADATLVERREDFRFLTGCRQVVRGLEAGIKGMKVGGQRRIIVPGRWGYSSAPPLGINVPFGAILVYLVEAQATRPIEKC